LIGAGVAAGGFEIVEVGGIVNKVLIPLLTSPFIAIIIAYLITLAIIRIFINQPANKMNRKFKRLQLVSTFLFSITDATNDELHCYWIDDASVGMTDADSSVDGTAVRMRGMAPTASKWLYLKVEMQDRGSGNGVRATFLAVDHLGRSMEKVFNTSVDRDCLLCYYLGVESRGTASTFYIRNANWEQSIPNM